jgi:hypothetical protein
VTGKTNLSISTQSSGGQLFTPFSVLSIPKEAAPQVSIPHHKHVHDVPAMRLFQLAPKTVGSVHSLLPCLGQLRGVQGGLKQ